MKRTKKQCIAITGGLGSPSKMPGKAYGISPFLCQTGERLSRIIGSVCSNCYARKGRYVFKNVTEAHARRLATVTAALADAEFRATWVASFAQLLRGETWFRWHDAGDLHSVEHFALICDIAAATPWVRHWLPTKEPRYVKRHAAPIPRNLVVRVSGPMVGGPAPIGFATVSVVRKRGTDARLGEWQCPAPKQGGMCGPCRACWSPAVSIVSYQEH